MIVGILKESVPGERRVAVVPEGVRALCQAGLQVRVQRDAGSAAGFDDAAYEEAGAQLEGDPAGVVAAADLLLRVQVRGGEPELEAVGPGKVLVGLMRPLDKPELAADLAKRGITAFSLELVPRITRAQSMDVLSSQATVAGYRAVLLAATRLPKMFPMLVTAAGTISPARVFVIGAGVAGLQAIATAKRLGAVVEAYDTRAAAAEQVESLGARFVQLDLDAGDAEDAGGYAKAQSEEFYDKQRRLMQERAARSDVVITTALVPGRRAPLLLDEPAVRTMRPGSVVVDLAAANGGNCALSEPDREIAAEGILILGPTNLPSDLPTNSSQMFSRNVVTFLQHLVKEGELDLDLEDEITRGALLTHNGQVTQPAVSELLGAGAR